MILQSGEVKGLSDAELLDKLSQEIGGLRVGEVHVLQYLAEVEDRLLHAKKAYPSLFAFCVEEKGLAEGTACRYIAAMRAAKKFPEI
jgi:recombinational DNA repair protein (RecF pathway)